MVATSYSMGPTRGVRHIPIAKEKVARRSSSVRRLGDGAFMNSSVKEGFPVAGELERHAGDEDKR
jgi:hypothetical protein